jgi:antitoxin CptB
MADETDIDSRRRRAAYRASHRGTKEMDWVLGRYADARLGAMSAEALSLFERLLALPDPELCDMLLPPHTPAPAEFAGLIAAVRAFHGLKDGEPR